MAGSRNGAAPPAKRWAHVAHADLAGALAAAATARGWSVSAPDFDPDAEDAVVGLTAAAPNCPEPLALGVTNSTARRAGLSLHYGYAGDGAPVYLGEVYVGRHCQGTVKHLPELLDRRTRDAGRVAGRLAAVARKLKAAPVNRGRLLELLEQAAAKGAFPWREAARFGRSLPPAPTGWDVLVAFGRYTAGRKLANPMLRPKYTAEFAGLLLAELGITRP